MNYGKRTATAGPDGQRVTSGPPRARGAAVAVVGTGGAVSAAGAPGRSLPGRGGGSGRAARGGSDDDSAPAAAENPSVEVEVNLLEGPRTGTAAPRAQRDERRRGGAGVSATPTRCSAARSRAGERAGFSRSPTTRSRHSRTSRRDPAPPRHVPVLEHGGARAGDHGRLRRARVQEALRGDPREGAHRARSAGEEGEPCSTLKDMWELRSDPTLDDDDAGIRGFLLQEFAKSGEPRDCGAYDGTSRPHGFRRSRGRGVRPVLPPGPRQKNLSRPHIASRAWKRRCSSRGSALRSSSSSIAQVRGPVERATRPTRGGASTCARARLRVRG